MEPAPAKLALKCALVPTIIDTTAVVTTESASLKARALKAADALPVVPGVLQRMLGLFARGDDLSVAQLASNVEQDVVIAGTILAIANSAMYGGRSRVSSMPQAIARIGMNKTRNVLLGLSVIRSVKKIKLKAPWLLIRFNAHSLATALLCDQIVQKAQSTDPEWAFMAGLLHDIGLVVMAFGLPEEVAPLLDHSGGDVSLAERERATLGFTHFELGAEMIARWNCPVAVQQAALFGQNESCEFSRPLGLGAVVKGATLLADAQTISIFDSSLDQNLTGSLLEALQIKNPQQFMADFHSDFLEFKTSWA